MSDVPIRQRLHAQRDVLAGQSIDTYMVRDLQ
jgi:hypothetical protein